MTRGSPCASSRSCARLCACGSHGGDPERAFQPGTASAGHRRGRQPGYEREPADSTGEYPALRNPAPSTTPPRHTMRWWRSDRARAFIRAPTTSRNECDFQATTCGDTRILAHAHHVAHTTRHREPCRWMRATLTQAHEADSVLSPPQRHMTRHGGMRGERGTVGSGPAAQRRRMPHPHEDPSRSLVSRHNRTNAGSNARHHPVALRSVRGRVEHFGFT